MDKSFNQNQNMSFITKACILAIACAVLALTLLLEGPINCIFNKTAFYLSDGFTNSNFQIHFIDAGQGDCTFIQVGDTSVMIDAGPNDSANHIIKYLQNLGYKKNSKIDYLILTHTDSDHIGGASQLLDEFSFQNIYRPMAYSTFDVDNNLATESYNVFYSSLWREVSKSIYYEVDDNHRFYNFAGESIVDNKVKIDFYAPINENYQDSNDYSPIMILKSSGFKFAFVGDVSGEVEEQFLLKYQEGVSQSLFDCDILKVAHHGSSSSTTKEFLEAINPEVAIISCDANNNYNHPSDEVVNRLNSQNVKILRTDTMNSIVIYEENNILTINSGFMGVGSVYIEWKYIVISIITILLCVIIFNKRLV